MTEPKPDKIIVIAPNVRYAHRWADDHGFRWNQIIYVSSYISIRGHRQGTPHVILDGPCGIDIRGMYEIFSALHYLQSPEYREDE